MTVVLAVIAVVEFVAADSIAIHFFVDAVLVTLLAVRAENAIELAAAMTVTVTVDYFVLVSAAVVSVGLTDRAFWPPQLVVVNFFVLFWQ